MIGFTFAPAALLAILALLPRAMADQVCDKDASGNERCHNNFNDSNVHLIIGLVLIGMAIVFIVIAGWLKHRRQKQAIAAAVANGPIMSYAPQGPTMGAAIPSTYDPNAPPQPYPFNGYGQNVGGPIAGGPINPPAQYAAPDYAPPVGAPGKETV